MSQVNSTRAKNNNSQSESMREKMIFRALAAASFVLLSASTFFVSAAESYTGQIAGIGDVEVELLSKGSPVFPRRAKSYGVSGSVVVRFSVDTEGNAVGAVIVESKPRRMFDRSAMRYMQTLKFKPYVVDGDATEVKDLQMTVAYRLEG